MCLPSHCSNHCPLAFVTYNSALLLPLPTQALSECVSARALGIRVCLTLHCDDLRSMIAEPYIPDVCYTEEATEAWHRHQLSMWALLVAILIVC